MPAIGIRLEDKNKWEKRVPLVPQHVKELRSKGLDVIVQRSTLRAFNDKEYEDVGATMVDDTPDTSLIFAVKEIPMKYFKENRSYVFFSHTIKGQDYNMPMLKHIMDLGVNLIDYERIADDNGRRIVFFGREAGQAGMVDTLWTLGQRLKAEGHDTPFSDVKTTPEYEGLDDIRAKLKLVGDRITSDGLPEELCPLIVGFAGYGNVSLGAQDIFDSLPFTEITPAEALTLKKGEYSRNTLYKVVFKEEHMARRKEGEFDLQDYYTHPENYVGVFKQYIPHITMLVNCIYWEERYPRLVSKADLKELYSGEGWPTFRVAGDISCDYEGSIEGTLHGTESDEPSYVYDAEKDDLTTDLGAHGLAIMAVDNLPAELPREASKNFGDSLLPFVPQMAATDFDTSFEELALPPEIKRAMILHKGKLTPDYEYIQNFL